MNSLLERGLRQAATILADALDDSPVRDMRPQQFDPSERTPRRRQRTEQSEERVEQDAAREEERRPRADIEVEVESVTSAPSVRAIELRRQLRDRGSVQRAFLLKELLDQPRALRPHRSNDQS